MASNLIKAAIAAAALAVPGVAHAANAVVTTDLNFRTGPGVNYRNVGTIPRGYPVTVNGCLDNRSWCDVTWAGRRGWVSSHYIAYGQVAPQRHYVQPRYVQPRVTFSFGFGNYDRHHDYRDRHHRRRHHDGDGRRHRDGDRRWR